MPDQALSIIRDRYTDFWPTLACEKLYKCHGIWLPKETTEGNSSLPDDGCWTMETGIGVGR